MSQHSDYRTLISRGRKAGLNVRDLYTALASRSDDTAQKAGGQADCNGYVLGHNAQGQREYHPQTDGRRS